MLALHVPKGNRFALLDFPNHANVGDSAIWLGEMAFFASHNLHPAYVCTVNAYDWNALEKAVPEGTFFMHGGGNFGDIWPAHQQFREAVLQRFPNRKIVQLPQSIHFEKPENLARAAAIINAHPDFTLLVRDLQSLALAQEHFTCTIQLCPDMAFCLGAVERPVLPSHPLMMLMRTDREKVMEANGAHTPLPPDTLITDWLVDDVGVEDATRRQAMLKLFCSFSPASLNPHYRRSVRYRLLAEARLQRGLRLLASGEFVITDRLHAHILCLLMNIPHAVLDNSYGKVSGFMQAWTKDWPHGTLEKTLSQALAHLQETA